ncbi:MAG: hypothetical protein K6A72_09030 [Lachnospiraceae bacterium]|nr:hypothetical protein [Lachnospiraceae bacterium]
MFSKWKQEENYELLENDLDKISSAALGYDNRIWGSGAGNEDCKLDLERTKEKVKELLQSLKAWLGDEDLKAEQWRMYRDYLYCILLCPSLTDSHAGDYPAMFWVESGNDVMDGCIRWFDNAKTYSEILYGARDLEKCSGIKEMLLSEMVYYANYSSKKCGKFFMLMSLACFHLSERKDRVYLPDYERILNLSGEDEENWKDAYIYLLRKADDQWESDIGLQARCFSLKEGDPQIAEKLGIGQYLMSEEEIKEAEEEREKEIQRQFEENQKKLDESEDEFDYDGYWAYLEEKHREQIQRNQQLIEESEKQENIDRWIKESRDAASKWAEKLTEPAQKAFREAYHRFRFSYFSSGVDRHRMQSDMVGMLDLYLYKQGMSALSIQDDDDFELIMYQLGRMPGPVKCQLEKVFKEGGQQI